MSKYVIANWKMHGGLERNAQFFSGLKIEDIKNLEIGVCAPAPYWFQLKALCQNTKICWGGQDVSEHFEGAYTGEISISMLEDFDCHYIILGHSERRQYHAESSGTVARKLDRVMQSLKQGLIPIVCIGEHLSEREKGCVEEVLSEQLDPVLSVLKLHLNRQMLLAYEPVWAIGTGVTAQPEEVREVHAWIADYVMEKTGRSVPIIYGGSVKPDNAEALIRLPYVDGFLVGGASLKAETFNTLLECCAKDGN